MSGYITLWFRLGSVVISYFCVYDYQRSKDPGNFLSKMWPFLSSNFAKHFVLFWQISYFRIPAEAY